MIQLNGPRRRDGSEVRPPNFIAVVFMLHLGSVTAGVRLRHSDSRSREGAPG